MESIKRTKAIIEIKIFLTRDNNYEAKNPVLVPIIRFFYDNRMSPA